MNDALRSGESIDQELTGEPVEAHGYVLTPRARVRGRVGSMSDERGSGRYGWVAIRPFKVSVLDRNGNTQELRIANQQTQAITAMAAIGLVIAIASLLTARVTRSRRG